MRSIPARLEPDRIADAVSAGVTVGWHVVPDRWVLLSGNELDVALASVLQLLGIDGEAERDALNAAAAEIPPSAQQLRLEGAHLWRAALVAGADLSAATLARSDAVGGPHRRIVATGGGVRGAAARAVKEQRLGPIEWSPVQEATGRGKLALAA